VKCGEDFIEVKAEKKNVQTIFTKASYYLETDLSTISPTSPFQLSSP
jgi:hypothetical protein